jgi:hypothetical protein
MKVVITVLDYVAGFGIGFWIAWEWRGKIATERYNLLKALYHNYRNHEGNRYLGKGYELGFQDGYTILEKEDAETDELTEAEIATDQDLLALSIQAWKDNEDSTLKIYPFLGRKWGRD